MYKLIIRSLCFCVILSSLISCQENYDKNSECFKYSNEQYHDEVIDSTLEKEAHEYQEILLERFEETSIKDLEYEAYQLQYYSSHGFGFSIKFEKKSNGFYMSKKCLKKEGWFPDCENSRHSISQEDWEEFERMIYEFNYWTEEAFRTNEGVLDGDVYFLEGNRPSAKNCNKKTYKLIGRGSPIYDKIGALCDYIADFEESLTFRYNQINF